MSTIIVFSTGLVIVAVILYVIGTTKHGTLPLDANFFVRAKWVVYWVVLATALFFGLVMILRTLVPDPFIDLLLLAIPCIGITATPIMLSMVEPEPKNGGSRTRKLILFSLTAYLLVIFYGLWYRI